jgi:hypothetical protein
MPFVRVFESLSVTSLNSNGSMRIKISAPVTDLFHESYTRISDDFPILECQLT